MKDKFWAWYITAFRIFVPISSFAWTCNGIINLRLLSHKWDVIIIMLIFALYLGSYLLIQSRKKQ